jgi:hypothetical protein
MAPEPEKEFTLEEVAKHNKVDDCWLVIGNDATGKKLPGDWLLLVGYLVIIVLRVE